MIWVNRSAWRCAGPIALVLACCASVLAAQNDVAGTYKDATTRIIAEATSAATATQAWNRLAELTDKYPARLSGSTNLEGAIQWAADQMKRDGLANVRVDKVMVPHWVRGAESGAIVRPYPQGLAIAALGGSVGGDVQAEALVVKSFDELEVRRGRACDGSSRTDGQTRRRRTRAVGRRYGSDRRAFSGVLRAAQKGVLKSAEGRMAGGRCQGWRRL